MAEAKAKDNWSHTSALLAMTANVNRDPKKSRTFKLADFNPYASRAKTGVRITKSNIGILKRFL